MTTYEPSPTTWFVLNEGHVDGTPYPLPEHLSLNLIATEVYGKEYHGQQTGDMLPNDSVHRYVMDEEAVETELWENGPVRHYLGYDSMRGNTVYAEGISTFDYWQSLSHSDDPSKVTAHSSSDLVDHRGGVYRFDFEVYRQAPEPRWVIADLIKKGHLPYGNYLLYVSW